MSILPASVYDRKQIAKELQATAQGDAYHGNALYVAVDFPELTRYQRSVLRRYLDGTNTVEDRFALQHIAIDILEPEE